MSNIEKKFASFCESRVETYRTDMSPHALENLDHTLTMQAWEVTSELNLTPQDTSELGSRLVKIAETFITSEVFKALKDGAANFKEYIDDLNKKGNLRWYAEPVSGGYFLLLQQEFHVWIKALEIKALFKDIGAIEQYIGRIQKETGVELKLEVDNTNDGS